MVNGVHDHASDGGPYPAPSFRPRFTERSQAVLGIPDLTNGGPTIHMHPAHLAGAQAQGGICPFTSDELRSRTRTPSELRPFSRLQLNTMDCRADRNASKWKRITNSYGGFGTGHDLGTYLEPAGRDNIPAFSVRVKHERYPGAAVRIVLDLFDLTRHPVLIALEIDNTVAPLVATTTMAHRDATQVVAPPASVGLGEQPLIGLSFVHPGSHDPHHEAAPRRSRL
jgi:hypothetical protein